MARIPVNIIGGFLGAGKTTAIIHLLKNKPENEKWAVIVNELGDVSIDGFLLRAEDKEITVKDISGGCMCCVGKVMFDAALAQMAVKIKPHRILVEPSGAGHMKDLIKTLSSRTFSPYVAMRAPLCLIDPQVIYDHHLAGSDIFIEQITYSPLLAVSKTDMASPSQLLAFEEWVKTHYPGKKIFFISHGRIPLEILDTLMPEEENVKEKKELIYLENRIKDDHKSSSQHQPSLPRQPRMMVNKQHGFCGIGFIFHKDDCFHTEKLKTYIAEKAPLRMKGIVNTSEGWMLFQFSGGLLTVDRILPHAESRIEFIFHSSLCPDEEQIKRALVEMVR